MFVVCAYPRKMFVVSAYPRKCLLLARSNDLVSKNLQLPFAYPWTRLFNTHRGSVCKNRISAETCLAIRFLETAYTHTRYSLTHGAEPFSRSRQLCNYLWTSQHFMNPEGSLPCSQEPSTGPYPQPSHPIWPILACHNKLHVIFTEPLSVVELDIFILWMSSNFGPKIDYSDRSFVIFLEPSVQIRG
jgi:hypothetical protein